MTANHLAPARERLLPNIDITYDELLEEETSKKDAEITVSYHLRMTEAEKGKKLKTLISDLKSEIQRNPNNKILYNYLFTVYLFDGNNKEAEITYLKIEQKFPRYLFGKLTYGQHLCNNGRHNEVPLLFNGKFTIPEIDSDRKIFHASEVTAFHSLMANYFLHENELEKAYDNFRLSEEIVEESVPTPIYLDLLKRLATPAKQLIIEAQQDASKMEEMLTQLTALVKQDE